MRETVQMTGILLYHRRCGTVQLFHRKIWPAAISDWCCRSQRIARIWYLATDQIVLPRARLLHEFHVYDYVDRPLCFPACYVTRL